MPKEDFVERAKDYLGLTEPREKSEKANREILDRLGFEDVGSGSGDEIRETKESKGAGEESELMVRFEEGGDLAQEEHHLEILDYFEKTRQKLWQSEDRPDRKKDPEGWKAARREINAKARELVFKELSRQIEFAGEAAIKIDQVFSQNPDAPIDQIFERGFPQELRKEMSLSMTKAVCQGLERCANNREVIHGHTKGVDPREKVQEIFGFETLGGARMFRSPYSIFIDLNDSRDFVRVTNKEARKVTDSEELKSLSYADSTQAFVPLNLEKENPKHSELDGILIIGNNILGNPEELKRYLTHEQRHVKNKFLINNIEELARKNLDRLPKEMLWGKGTSLEILDGQARAYEVWFSHLKDEILGYLTSNTPEDWESLECYWFGYKKEAEGKEYFLEKNQDLPNVEQVYRDKIACPAGIVRRLSRDNYVRLARKMYEDAGTDEEKESVLNKLAMTPLERWPRTWPNESKEIIEKDLMEDLVREIRAIIEDNLIHGWDTDGRTTVKTVEYLKENFDFDMSELQRRVSELVIKEFAPAYQFFRKESGARDPDLVRADLDEMVKGGILSQEAVDSFFQT